MHCSFARGFRPLDWRQAAAISVYDPHFGKTCAELQLRSPPRVLSS